MFFNFIKKNKLLSFLIAIGFFAYFLITFPSGSYYCFNHQCGVYFWGAHEHDGIWHLAVAETAFSQWPPRHPVFAGANLSGYNIFLDLVIFILAKTGIPAIIWYFKILPIIWFILYTFLSLKLAEKIARSYWFKVFFLFFNYFGASFALFFTLYHKKSIWGSSSIMASQPLLSLVNLQFAFSLIFILLTLITFFEKNKIKKILIYSIIIFINLALKFYGGVVNLFLILGLILIEKNKLKEKLFSSVFIGAFALISLLIFYQPFSATKTGLPLIFSPFAMVHNLIEERDLFYLPSLVNARYFLYEKGFGPRLLAIELFSSFLFLFFNFGVRFFGLVYFLIGFFYKKINRLHLIIFLTIIFSCLLTISLIQKGMWWNTIQFTYYGLFLANIFAALFLTKLLSQKNIKLLFLAIFLILINIPENIDVLRGFNPSRKTSFIDKKELEALNFLKKRDDGIIFAPSLDINTIHKESAYVSAFTGKPTYFNDRHVLSITGVDWQSREKRIADVEKINLEELPVRYFYFLKKDKNYPTFIQKINSIKKYKKIFDNQEVLIFEK